MEVTSQFARLALFLES
uniref:Uncharacterized protein n=1 Tax=Arundo donax TaxID=35708 RepID=A0A0A8ZTB6_ARUDO